MKRLDLTHRRHRVIAAMQAGKPAAAVFDGSARLFITNGPTLEAAADEAKAWIDQRVDGERIHRRRPHIGTPSEYRRAFQALRLGEHHPSMLREHANAPDRTMTAGELARSADYDDFQFANSYYGKLGRKVAEFLDLPLPIDKRLGKPVWTMALADIARESDAQGHWRWAMHPEVAEALHELNMA